MSEQQRQLIFDLLLRRISAADFQKRFPTEQDPRASALGMLRQAFAERDPVGVEFGLYLTAFFGVLDQHGSVLCALATADWHERHEDVVDALAKLRSPLSVDALCATASVSFPYREYDETSSLGVKCIYALASIQDRAAIDCLTRLARSENEVMRSEALDALTRIQKDGESPEARIAAQDCLVRLQNEGSSAE